MNENLNEALEQIGDRHLEEAANYYQRSRRSRWLGAIAAVLAVAIAWGAIWHHWPKRNDEPSALQSPAASSPAPTRPITTPGVIPLSGLVAQPKYPSIGSPPSKDAFATTEEWLNAYAAWRDAWANQYSQPDGYADNLSDFFSKSIPLFLSGEGNRAYSPVNVYLAMAMLAETASGNSQQQILNLLGAESIEELRTQANQVWNGHFSDRNTDRLLLSNSVWLDNEHTFNADTLQSLADSYYASVYSGDLGSEYMNEVLQSWLDSQTGNLLNEHSQNLELDPNSVFALASTVYFSAKWSESFSEDQTTNGIFHGSTDTTVAFMHNTLSDDYFWGTDFGAIRLSMSNQNSMWLILPDEDKTVEDILNSNEYWKMIQNPSQWKNRKRVTLHVTMPKFDISTKSDLIGSMMQLGVTDIFNPDISDFSAMTDTPQIFVNKIEHAVRIVTNEGGVVAAAYTVIDAPSLGIPPEEEVAFTLDRPFFFAITSQDSLPLFTGVVEQP